MYVSEDRKEESLSAYYNTLSAEQRKNIKSVCMDMWNLFFNATVKAVPDSLSKIVFDKFHIVKMINKAVDDVRKSEYQSYHSQNIHNPLKGTKHLWLFGKENIPDYKQQEF